MVQTIRCCEQAIDLQLQIMMIGLPRPVRLSFANVVNSSPQHHEYYGDGGRQSSCQRIPRATWREKAAQNKVAPCSMQLKDM